MNNFLLYKKDNNVDPETPSKDEKKKLLEIYDYLRASEIKMLFMLYPTLILIIITYFLDDYPLAIFIIVMYAIMMLMGILYLMIKRNYIKKCPRCSMKGVPANADSPVRGKCPRCKMSLGVQDEKNIRGRYPL